jgi:hypothetical protein
MKTETNSAPNVPAHATVNCVVQIKIQPFSLTPRFSEVWQRLYCTSTVLTVSLGPCDASFNKNQNSKIQKTPFFKAFQSISKKKICAEIDVLSSLPSVALLAKDGKENLKPLTVTNAN